MTTEVREVLHMNQGTGETSYARSSYIQRQVLLLTKSIKEEAMRQLYNKKQPLTLCIADLGCSSSELNKPSIIFDLIATAEEVRRKLGHGPQDYQVYLNDLPGNDFNTVFRSLKGFQEKLKKEMGDGFGHCFVNGVSGSFYDRLFPTNSLHFVHSSYSIHWLSQVPQGIDDNKRNICIARTSPPSVINAYCEQFQKDFSMFLRCRSQEMKPGGRMVLTCLGRESNEPYTIKGYYMYELLASILGDMVSEGHIAEEKLNSFNIPHYSPSEKELRILIEREGSFALNQVHVSQVQWEGEYNNYNKDGSISESFGHYDFANCMRSVVESLLITQFGEAIIDEVFKRYAKIVHVIQDKENKLVINVTVLMTRIG